ncbi:M20/M25/M40 family metallo-hydrolase [Truepera radiovictrix]|uniref:Peptidase M20 n=1 Tax=Truepera radiovictrix (strain DSM 17093 / CIP 108686 / LMG 22925 / RQ-24) TaxID=649638 RepID=D7CUT5_TRURR|nr:peptidase M20 [Truepera radiovictrix DSM 17093]
MLEAVFDKIDQNAQLYTTWLQELCRQPSVAAQNRGMAETAALVARLLEAVGARAERVPTAGFPVVYGELQQGAPGARTLAFYNHYDVQPEDPLEAWDSPPFAAEIRGGHLYARGAADNKGNLAARLAAVHAYRQVGALPVNLKFIVEGEEEIGSPNIAAFAAAHPDKVRADGCVWEFGYKNPDGQLQVSLGVKGMCYVELRVRGANTDLHSANAAVVENPAWRLVWALATLKGTDERVLIEGFYDRVLPPSAEEVALLDEMAYNEAETLEQLGLGSFLGGRTGRDLKEALVFGPTCTICGLSAGYSGPGTKTVLPATASAKLDFRLVPDQDPHEVLAALRRHLDARGFGDIEVTPYSLEHPAKTDLGAPLIETVLAQARRVYGREATVNRLSPGTGPMYPLCQAQGVPAVSFGVGHAGSNNHAPNENIALQDFIDGIKMVAAVIHGFGAA